MKIEIRHSTAAPAKLEGRKLTGLAVPYGQDSLDLGGFVERFMPGSLTDTIKSGKVEIWAHHDRTKPIGSQASGNLRLWETAQGINYECDLPEGNTDAENVRSLLTATETRSAIIGGTSFGFWVNDAGERWKREAGQNVREVIKADIDHVSPVVSPAYPQTTAALRSLASQEVTAAADVYGIDLNQVAAIFLASHRGLPLNAGEMDVATRAVDILRKHLPTPKLLIAIEEAAKILV